MQTDNLRVAVERGDVYLPDVVRASALLDVDGWQNGLGAMVGEVHYLVRPHYADDDAWQRNQRALRVGRLEDVDRDAAFEVQNKAREKIMSLRRALEWIKENCPLLWMKHLEQKEPENE